MTEHGVRWGTSGGTCSWKMHTHSNANKTSQSQSTGTRTGRIRLDKQNCHVGLRHGNLPKFIQVRPIVHWILPGVCVKLFMPLTLQYLYGTRGTQILHGAFRGRAGGDARAEARIGKAQLKLNIVVVYKLLTPCFDLN